jgi:resuscitation-promoting factor RpfB
MTVTITVDGQTIQHVSTASNVRALLDESGILLSDTDLVDPPLFTPVEEGLEVTITRVTESVVLLEQAVPFGRRTVRNESMPADDPPLIVQAGKSGLTEFTVRIVFHDGLEYSRQQTNVTVLEAPQDEIVMIGVGSGAGSVTFDGNLAYISGGNSVILRGNSAFPEPINTGGILDQRVFSLSPTGSHLLYTRVATDTERFNTMWVVETERGASPRPLEVDNVLWAGWNPVELDPPQVAYTRGVRTELLPGWEANNDLWIGDLPLNENRPFEPELLVESYPATYGWWGGNYAWSPAGRYVAYAFANEVGIIDTGSSAEGESPRQRLQTFTEYNTRSDWVWVPSISWSPDGRYLAYIRHAGDDPDVAAFDMWVAGLEDGVASRFVAQSGMWSHVYWSPRPFGNASIAEWASQIALLRATNPLDSQRSSYTLWLMDRDGSNLNQIYPPPAEISHFPREHNSMTWGPSGRELAFVFNNKLHVMNLDTRKVRIVTQDDSIASNPTWAPYGLAATEEGRPRRIQPTPVPVPTSERSPAG